MNNLRKCVFGEEEKQGYFHKWEKDYKGYIKAIVEDKEG